MITNPYLKRPPASITCRVPVPPRNPYARPVNPYARNRTSRLQTRTTSNVARVPVLDATPDSCRRQSHAHGNTGLLLFSSPLSSSLSSTGRNAYCERRISPSVASVPATSNATIVSTAGNARRNVEGCSRLDDQDDFFSSDLDLTCLEDDANRASTVLGSAAFNWRNYPVRGNPQIESGNLDKDLEMLSASETNHARFTKKLVSKFFVILANQPVTSPLSTYDCQYERQFYRVLAGHKTIEKENILNNCMRLWSEQSMRRQDGLLYQPNTFMVAVRTLSGVFKSRGINYSAA